MEFRMLTFEVKGALDGEVKTIPIDFFATLSLQNILDRWNGNPTPGSTVQNLQFLKKYELPELNDSIFYGRFVEIELTRSINLMNLQGLEQPMNVPNNSGRHSGFTFAVCPAKCLLVLENGRGVEQRLASYLNFWLQKFWNPSRTDPASKLDSILVSAIPIETNPVNFIRQNHNLGSFEAILNVREFQREDYGVLGRLFGNLGEEQKLKVKIEIATHRGGQLPEILTTNLATLLEQIAPTENLSKVKVKEVVGGRKQSPINLLNALEQRTAIIREDTIELKKIALLDYMIELIEND